MTTYTVSLVAEGEGPAMQSTPKLDDALDWYTNGVEAVMDPEDPSYFVTLAVDGVIWAACRDGGLQQDGGDVIDLGKVRAA